MRTSRLLQLLSTLVLAMFCGVAYANTTASTPGLLRVSAVVKQFLRLKLVSSPGPMQVSQEDISRGYIDVRVPMLLAMEGNSSSGGTIVFGKMGEYVQTAEVHGLGQQVAFTVEGAVNWVPIARHQTLEFYFRMRLARALSPGSYPWPIQVSMIPA